MCSAVKLSDDPDIPGLKLFTLNHPEKLNAMTEEMGDAVSQAVATLNVLPPNELRAVVLTGAGRAFSAGGDLDFLQSRAVTDPTSNSQLMLAFYRRFLSIRNLSVPVIACINGPAIGAGLSFAMAADVRYTVHKAKLGFSFVGLGLHPGMGATHTVRAVAGEQVANRLLLSGEILSGEQAAATGLVSASLPTASLCLETARALAEQITKQSPLAVRATLKTLRAQQDYGLESALQREADAQSQSYASADYKEGITALAERRLPVFPGC